ncbi:MAG TPA: diguanylate cyclase [Xanthomonadaceae bacterium]|nr:diguanylate cyclase [Xanthomonadaceae bacterium]
MRWWAPILCLLAASCALAADTPRLELLSMPLGEGDIAAVRAATRDWNAVPETALRRQPAPSWWRVHLPEGASADEPWVLALKEAYDADLIAYAAPDYRAQRLATFDSDARQLGSKHRLTVTLPAAHLQEPLYLELRRARAQPIRLSAAPLSRYLVADAARIRTTSALLSAQLLLGLVAAIYAFALRRHVLLLFSVWVLSSALYLLVMSGDIAGLLPGSALLPHAMRLNSIAINVGLVCAYGFLMWFLDIASHYPRVATVFRVLLAGCVVVLTVLMVDPANIVFLHANNIITMLLALLALGVGVARAAAGSPQGWFYLFGWGSVSLVGMYRAGLFLAEMGTPDWLETGHPAINTFGALVLVLATARAARYAEREMHAARVVARTDPLTGLANRSQLDASLALMIETGAATGQSLSLMFLDLDRFKAINDRHGHAFGDDCLAAFADILRGHVRASDLLARYGGEEVVLVLPGAAQAPAAEIAETLRAAVEREGREVQGRPVALTVSIGLATWQPGETDSELLARADAALYRAKREGRNRVAVADDHADHTAVPL